MVNCWFGARWFGYLGSPYERECFLGVPRFECQSTNQPKPPSQTISWGRGGDLKNYIIFPKIQTSKRTAQQPENTPQRERKNIDPNHYFFGFHVNFKGVNHHFVRFCKVLFFNHEFICVKYQEEFTILNCSPSPQKVDGLFTPFPFNSVV